MCETEHLQLCCFVLSDGAAARRERLQAVESARPARLSAAGQFRGTAVHWFYWVNNLVQK